MKPSEIGRLFSIGTALNGDPIHAAIDKIMRTVPEIWGNLDRDKLTALEDRALMMCVARGLIELRIGSIIIFTCDEHPLRWKGEWSGRGYHAMMAPVLAAAEAIFKKASASGESVSCATIPSKEIQWRLSGEGSVARADLSGTKAQWAEAIGFAAGYRGDTFMEGSGHILELTREAPREMPKEAILVRVENVHDIAAAINAVLPIDLTPPLSAHLGLNEIQKKFAVAHKPGPAAVLAAMLSDATKPWHARTLANSENMADVGRGGKNPAESNVRNWLAELAAVKLTEQHPTAKTWTLGPASRR